MANDGESEQNSTVCVTVRPRDAAELSILGGRAYTGGVVSGLSLLGGDLASTGVRDRGTRAEAHAPRKSRGKTT